MKIIIKCNPWLNCKVTDQSESAVGVPNKLVTVCKVTQDSNWQPFNSRPPSLHLLRNVREVTLRKNNTGYSRERWKTTRVIHFHFEKTPELPVSSIRFVPSTRQLPKNSCSKATKAIMGHIQMSLGQNMQKFNSFTIRPAIRRATGSEPC